MTIPPTIQDQIDALPRGNPGERGDGGTVTIPAGWNQVPRPLRVRRPYTRLCGVGPVTSTLAHGGFVGPVLVVAPDGYPPVPRCEPLASGSLGGMLLDGTANAYLDLKDAEVSLDGLTSFTAECFLRLDDLTPGFFLSSRGCISPGQGEPCCFAVWVDDAARLRVRFTVNGVLSDLHTAVDLLVSGHTYHLALVYDGTRLRLWLDGVAVIDEPMTGAMSQDPTEQITLGPMVTTFPNTDPQPSCRGKLDSVTLWKTARYGEPFTPPTAVPEMGSDILVHVCPGDQWDLFSLGRTDGGRPVYLPAYRPGYGAGFVDWFVLQGVQVEGDGPYFFNTVGTRLQDCLFSAYTQGPLFAGASFLNSCRDIVCRTNSAHARTCFASGYGGCNEMSGRNEFLGTAAYPLLLAGGSGNLNGVTYFAPANTTKIPLVLRGGGGGNNTYAVRGLYIDDEIAGDGRKIVAGVLLYDVTAVLQSGCLELANGLPDLTPSLIVERCGCVTLDTVQFRNNSNSPAVVLDSPTGTVEMRNCERQWGSGGLSL